MESIGTLAQDLRLAIRGLSRQTAWTTVAILTLTLGIGANTALFSIVNAVLLRPLPYPDADRVVSLSVQTKNNDLGVVPSDEYRAWAADAKSFSAIAVNFPDQMVDTQGEVPTLITGSQVTASYFDVLGVAPEAGRVFTAAEDVKDGPALIVLSDELWRSRFGADRAVIGKSVSIGEKQKIVIGVMPASFSRTRRSRYWTPAALEANDPEGVTFFYPVLGRLRRGATIESARAELATINARIIAARPVPKGPAEPPTAYAPIVMTYHERLFGGARPALLILLSSVGVLLLIACANVSNLLLARATRRQREFAVRMALGAGRGRVVQYLLCESLVLSVVGGAFGFVVPWLVTGPLVRLSPAAVASVEHVGVDGTVLAVTAGVVLITSLVFGLIPAFAATRSDLARLLASGGTRTTGTARQHRLRGMIVVAELATALILLTGAGLLGKSLVRATTVDPGFVAENLYSFRISLPRARYDDPRATVFFKALQDRARAVRGVQSAALSDLTPLSGVPASSSTTDAEGHVLEYDDASVGPGFFTTVGLAIKQGRVFDATDGASAMQVVISDAMARMAFPGRSPIGQTLGSGTTAKTVIGVVADVRQRGLEKPSRPLVYRPIADTGMTSLGTRASLLVRVDRNPAAVALSMRAIIHEMDSRIVPPEMRSTDDIIAEAAAPRKFNSLLLGAFAALAATLAAIGLYGVLAYLVTDRTHEIGIRIALGADTHRVLRLVMSQGTRLIVPGIALGLVGSATAVRLLRAMLFGIGEYDVTTFVLAAVVLSGVALLACYLPARRATNVDPMIALRAE